MTPFRLPDPDGRAASRARLGAVVMVAAALLSCSGTSPIEAGGAVQSGAPAVDLALRMAVDNPDPTEGDTVVITLYVRNAGPVDVANVTAEEILPGDLLYAAHSVSQGSLDTVRGVWPFGPLPASQEATLAISVVVGPGTADRTITSQASLIFASNQDSTSTNDTTSIDITPQLRITGDAPTFDPASDVMQVEDDFDNWTGFNRAGIAGAKVRVYRDSAVGGGDPPATVQMVTGRGGAGQAVRITYPTQVGSAQSRHHISTSGVATPVGYSSFQEVWIRTSPGASSEGFSPKWIQHYHADVEGATRIQISSFKFAAGSPSLGGLLPGDYWHVNSLANSLGLARNAPLWSDINDGVWHKFTTEVRANSAQGARDGVARMWVDGILVVDLSAAGVFTERTDNGELDQLAYGVAIGDVHVGELLFLGSVATWTMDIDDFRRWRPR
jgi:uncharacterized repeat protein (TIGR01451 family)